MLVVPANGQVLYRLLSKGAPRLRDFMSQHEKTLTVPDGGQPPVPRQPDDEFADWVSVSMFATIGDALEIPQRWPTFVQAVHLVPGLGFSLARTEPDLPGHYDVWGDPQALLDQRFGPPRQHDAPSYTQEAD
jgi:hypothetical protein